MSAARRPDGCRNSTTCKGNGLQWTAPLSGDGWEVKRRRRRSVKQGAYWLLRRVTGKQPPWGSLTGIRPTTLFYERLRKGDSPQEAEEALLRLFDLRQDRAHLLRQTCDTQKPYIHPPRDAVDVYVGIPFCVTRCSYCSFFCRTSRQGKAGAAVPGRPFCGDGSGRGAAWAAWPCAPGALRGGRHAYGADGAAAFKLLERMRSLFGGAQEWTVEAGRPDTIDEAKLAAIAQSGVTRISVNPQTMNDQTLRLIGRAHTAEDAERAFLLARRMGFDNINMDLIAALPGETLEDFDATLGRVGALSPDSLTVHTLARKHGSVMNEFGFHPAPPEVAEAQVERAAHRAAQMGMRPYYLYRQKTLRGTGKRGICAARQGEHL